MLAAYLVDEFCQTIRATTCEDAIEFAYDHERLCELMDYAELPAERFAFIIEKPLETIQKWMTGELQPELSDMGTICALFRITPTIFMMPRRVDEFAKKEAA